jgi:hypothetical protein
MIQGGEQNHKGSRILPKPYRSNNYKWWKELLETQKRDINSKYKTLNKLDKSID